MPRLIIDGREIEVPAGTKVIDAAARLGIMIPRFCYHEALGSVGACRLCAVKFLHGPVGGVQMSCMINAQDGMIVSTLDEEAVAFRKQVIEWLMINHPHDCPVCDEGGQCLLQDETVSGGHGLRRYLGKKRTYRDQYLGEYISHEMNRCIHCYRCSRFYQEFAGYRDLGVMQIANRVYFGRFEDGQLESPFSGNLVDVCPTGVYTDKTSRYRVRHWDLERAPSICLHCSLGCNTVANARYREVLRVEAGVSKTVNGHFICDRGRFGYAYASLPERPRRAVVSGRNRTMEEAVEEAAAGLRRIGEKWGWKAVACLGSPRSSVETQSMLKRWASVHEGAALHYFAEPRTEAAARAAVASLNDELAISLRELEKTDFILGVGVDPLNEAPMLALAMRQAWRKGATAALVDPRPVTLPMPFEHVPVRAGELGTWVESLLECLTGDDLPLPQGERAGVRGEQTDIEKGAPATWAARLRQARCPVVVCGTEIASPSLPRKIAALAGRLHELNSAVRLFFPLPGPNAFGAALLSRTGPSFDQTLSSIERGETKALLIVESDPLFHCSDRPRLEAALRKLEWLVVCDYLPSVTASLAHAFLPTTTHWEGLSGFINNEGRLQWAQQVHVPGTPIYQVSGGSHPPRTYEGTVPGSDPRPAWALLAALARGPGQPQSRFPEENPWEVVCEEMPGLKGAEGDDRAAGRERRILGEQPFEPSAESVEVKIPSVDETGEETFDLVLTEWTFGTEELSSYSPVVGRVEREPCLQLHTADAALLGIERDSRVKLHLDGGTLELPVSLHDNMARGTVVLPRHHRLPWRMMGKLPAGISRRRLEA